VTRRAGVLEYRIPEKSEGMRTPWHVQSGTSLPELMELGGWKSYEMVLRFVAR
jgi:hypothetical protein